VHLLWSKKIIDSLCVIVGRG